MRVEEKETKKWQPQRVGKMNGCGGFSETSREQRMNLKLVVRN